MMTTPVRLPAHLDAAFRLRADATARQDRRRGRGVHTVLIFLRGPKTNSHNGEVLAAYRHRVRRTPTGVAILHAANPEGAPTGAGQRGELTEGTPPTGGGGEGNRRHQAIHPGNIRYIRSFPTHSQIGRTYYHPHRARYA